MSDSTNRADSVSRWASLGIKLPEELGKAIETFETLRYVEAGRRPVFNLDAVTPKNAEQLVRAFADELAMSGDGNGQGHSPREKGKNEVVDLAARNVIRLAGQAVPDAIAQLTPEFDKVAQAYCEAVAQLPEKIQSDVLLSAGRSVVDAYHSAKGLAANLNRYDGWLASTLGLPLHTGKADPVLRILRPQTIIQLTKLDAAHNTHADPALAQLDPVFFTAAREGIPFGLNTVRECALLRRELETVQQTRLNGLTLTT